jgi:hypothetical protein
MGRPPIKPGLALLFATDDRLAPEAEMPSRSVLSIADPNRQDILGLKRRGLSGATCRRDLKLRRRLSDASHLASAN